MQFDVTVEGDAGEIADVVLLRSDHNTHSLTTGDRYVKLAFRPRIQLRIGLSDGSAPGELRVRSPRLPGQAVPGVYMLFVVDREGVPSVGRQVRLKL